MPLRDFECRHCGLLIEDVYFTRWDHIVLPKKCPKCKRKAAWKAKISVPADPVVKGGTPKFHVGK